MAWLYEEDYITWLNVILGIPCEKASPAMKLLAIRLPDILEWQYAHVKEDYDIWKDHIRVGMDVSARFTGMERHSIGRLYKVMHNNDIISYRTFREPINGMYYSLSYIHPYEKLWNGTISLLPGNERNRGNGQKNYVPICRKCYGEYMKKTGGIEYECLTCKERGVYYPDK